MSAFLLDQVEPSLTISVMAVNYRGLCSSLSREPVFTFWLLFTYSDTLLYKAIRPEPRFFSSLTHSCAKRSCQIIMAEQFPSRDY